MGSANLLKGEHIPTMLEIGAQRIPLLVRRNRRAKRIYLRYNPAEHAFSLTLPHRARLSDGVDFVRTKGDWVAETLDQQPKRQKLRANITIPILGQPTLITYNPELPGVFALRNNELLISGEKPHVPRRIEDALKKIVRNEVAELAHHKAALLGKRIHRITLRDTRSRWGSCSSDRNLMFSWRLVFAPFEVLDYVVSHEIAHLKHMDHSAQFWDTVESICPHYEEWKDWLRIHGRELYGYIR